MKSQRTVSICIPTWERPKQTIESFANVYEDERISEIIIVDDASSEESFDKLKQTTDHLPKVKLFRNETNLDCYRNKKRTVELADSDYVILFDSDNGLRTDYLDRVFSLEWDSRTIFTPSFAQPHFDFTAYEGLTLSKHNVSDYIYKPMLETMLNAANYFVNKNEYLRVWDGGTDPVTSDSIFQCYNWLRHGNEIYVTPDLTYDHVVHEGSHYRNNVNRTPQGLHESILQKIKNLK
jgi:glycosyltransferase involved in cell wall biosynthesis